MQNREVRPVHATVTAPSKFNTQNRYHSKNCPGRCPESVGKRFVDLKRPGWIYQDNKKQKAPDFSEAFGLHWTSPAPIIGVSTLTILFASVAAINIYRTKNGREESVNLLTPPERPHRKYHPTYHEIPIRCPELRSPDLQTGHRSHQWLPHQG